MKTFGPFRLDTSNHCLWRADERVPLTPKAFDVLRYMVEHNNRLVSQEELLEALWPETYVNPEGIRKYILEVRRILGDPAGKPAFIETIPKRGYQFIARVTDDSNTSRLNTAAQPLGNIVGRRAGLRELSESLQKALGGERQVVFITGEAGIGKTTLVDLFQQHADHPNLRIARGQCIEGFGGMEAYYPILEALGSLMRGPESSFLIQTLAKHAPTWLIQFPAWIEPEQKDSLQREIMGSTRERMVRELCEALEVITAGTPLLLVLEDLHWVDPSTLDLISAFARRRESAKVLLLGTYRPVDVVLSQSPLKNLKQDLQVRQLCREIAIECLEESDVADYLSKIFIQESIPPGFPGMIHQNSGGNPLFIVAIVQDMVNKGLIAEDRGRLILTAPLEDVYPGIPETLQQMLEIQMEQLSSEEKRILQSGSVAGERFSVWAAAAMLGAAPSAIEEQCDRLASRQRFIRSIGIYDAPDGAHSAHYEFRHALYRQALYRSLTGLNRSNFHLSLAERLMPVCIAGKPELASELALHFEAGRDNERAARYLILAAENTQKRFSYRDSLQVLRQALDLVSGKGLPTAVEIEIQIQLHQRIGDVQFALGEMSASVESYDTAANLAETAGLRAEQVALLMQMALPVWFIGQGGGDLRRGHQVLDRAIQVSRSLCEPLLLARTELGSACFRLLYDSWQEEDLKAWIRAKKTIRELAGPGTLLHVYEIYVQVLYGEIQQGMETSDVMIASAAGPTDYVGAFAGKGLGLMASGRYGEMIRIVRRERELARKNESEAWIWVLGEIWVRLLCFDFEGVRMVAETTMSTDIEAHAIWAKTAARVAAGHNEIARGNYTKAQEFFAQVRDPAITPKFFLHWHWRMQAALGTMEAHLIAGEIRDARREADAFLETARGITEPNLRALGWEINSRVAFAEANTPAAQSCIQNALAIVDRFDLPVSGWRVHLTAADLSEAAGDGAKADEHRSRARELIMEIADSFEPGEPLRASFLSAPPIQGLFRQARSA